MKTSSYVAFYVMAFTIIFNLNGMLFMLLGIQQLMTPVLILCTLVLTLNLYPSFFRGVGSLGKIYICVILSYLTVGFIATISNGEEIKLSYIIAYSISVLTIMCIASFTYMYYREHRKIFINTFFYLVFFSTLSIPFSPILLHIYKVPPAEISRGFGFFANPNEGGILSVIGLGLLLAAKLPGYQKVLFYFVLLTNTILTFSKSSILLFCMVSIGAYLASEAKVKFRYFFVIVITLVAAVYTVPVFYDNLEIVQKRRIDQVLAIATQGEINADTTSSRSELWGIGLEKINDHVLLGNGIGQLHRMKGVAPEGIELGVHNVFLMLWGEAGFFVLAGFLFFCAAYLFSWITLVHVIPKEVLIVTMVSFVCLFMDMLAAHNVLNLRMHNLFLGFSLGCFAYYVELSKKERFV